MNQCRYMIVLKTYYLLHLYIPIIVIEGVLLYNCTVSANWLVHVYTHVVWLLAQLIITCKIIISRANLKLV